MGNRSMFVGLDVHKETIDVSIAEGSRDGEVRHYGVIASDLEPLDKVVRALRAPNRRLHFVYEAGPCGFGIYRHLTGRGEDCVVVSPSMIPKRSGDRVKTDRRDSQMLARLHRAGELRAIYVPDDAECVPPRRPPQWPREARACAHAEAFVRDALIGSRGQSADHPRRPRPSQRADDPDLHASHVRDSSGADRPLEPADARPLSDPRGRHAGGGGHHPPPRGGVSRALRRSHPAQSPPGPARSRRLSDAVLGRPRPSVRSLRTAGVRVSLLPQSSLSEVSPRSDRTLADGAAHPPAAVRLLLTHLHPARPVTAPRTIPSENGVRAPDEECRDRAPDART